MGISSHIFLPATNSNGGLDTAKEAAAVGLFHSPSAGDDDYRSSEQRAVSCPVVDLLTTPTR